MSGKRASLAWSRERNHSEDEARSAALAWLKGLPNWEKLGPKRKEISALLVLNELDVVSGVLSDRTIPALIAKYPGYTAPQIKNTFAALRRHGLAKPEERFARVRIGKLQTASRYVLEATPDGSPWSSGDLRSQRSRKAAASARERGVGRLTFTPEQNERALADALRQQRTRVLRRSKAVSPVR